VGSSAHSIAACRHHQHPLINCCVTSALVSTYCFGKGTHLHNCNLHPFHSRTPQVPPKQLFHSWLPHCPPLAAPPSPASSTILQTHNPLLATHTTPPPLAPSPYCQYYILQVPPKQPSPNWLPHWVASWTQHTWVCTCCRPA
jgi:hypothetical protein